MMLCSVWCVPYEQLLLVALTVVFLVVSQLTFVDVFYLTR